MTTEYTTFVTFRGLTVPAGKHQHEVLSEHEEFGMNGEPYFDAVKIRAQELANI